MRVGPTEGGNFAWMAGIVLAAQPRERPAVSYPQHQADPGPGYPAPQQADQYYIRLIKHTGALILWYQRSFAVTGTLQECEAAYRSAQVYNLALGWWSMFSLLLMNWIALFSNMNAIRKVRAMARAGGGGPVQPHVATAAGQFGPPSPMPAGWYANPSGPGQRYWDGAGWTQWTNPPGHS
jgi:Protein of unknown function (DUF2510)